MNKMIAALAGMALLAGAAQAQPLGIGTSPQGTLTYAMGAAFARVLGDSVNIPARVQPGSGTGVVVPLIDKGEVDFGFVNALEITEAYSGTGSFRDRPQKNLRMVGLLMPIKVGFFVRKDAPIKSVRDIKGKSLAYGYTSQEIIKTVTDGMLANAGLTAADMTTVLVPNLIRGVDEFIAGKVDVGFFALGQAKVSEADASVGGIRFIPMIDEPAAEQRMQKVVPPSYIDTVRPGPGLAGVTEPLPTMHYDYVAFVNAGLPNERVKQIAKALAEGKAGMASAVKIFEEFDPKRMWRDFAVPYHDGALAYFREAGMQKSAK